MTINDELDLLQSSVVRSAIKLERETRRDTLDSLMPWVRHAANDRYPCKCGLDAVLKALRDDR